MNECIVKAQSLLAWIENSQLTVAASPRFFEDLDLSGFELGVMLLKYRLLPEMARGLSLPFTVVLCGGTNTGKSTLVNSLSGRIVSPSGGGVASFTKRNIGIGPQADLQELLTHRPGWQGLPLSNLQAPEAVAAGYQELGTRCSAVQKGTLSSPQTPDAVFPAVYFDASTTTTTTTTTATATSAQLPILIDTPDIDSSDTTCRRHSLSALALADVVIWLTTQQKYKDQAGMTYLDRAMALMYQRIDVFNQYLPRHAEAYDDLQTTYAARWPAIEATLYRIFEQPNLSEDALLDPNALEPLANLLQLLKSRAPEVKARNIQHGLQVAGAEVVKAATAFAERRRQCEELRRGILDRLAETLLVPLEAIPGKHALCELESAIYRVLRPRLRTGVSQMIGTLNKSVSSAWGWAKSLVGGNAEAAEPTPLEPIAVRDKLDLEYMERKWEDARADLLERSRARAETGDPLTRRFHEDLKKLDLPTGEEFRRRLHHKLETDTRERLMPLVSRFESDLETFCDAHPEIMGMLKATIPGMSALVGLGAAILSIQTMTILPGASEYLFGVVAVPVFKRVEKYLPERLLGLADQMSKEPFIQRAREDFTRTRAAIFLEVGNWLVDPVEDILRLSHQPSYNVAAVILDLQRRWAALHPELQRSGEDPA
jgi:GTPase SAR1 family protein